MNCPLCSSPLLFGATNCPCGYNLASAPGEELPIDLSYWEGLRAFWRLYWPMQIVGLLFAFALAMISPVSGGAAVLLTLVLQLALTGASMFLFMPRICGRPYRGFALVVVDVATGATTRKFSFRRRGQATFFLWWRQILAGMFASLLAMPLNAVLILIVGPRFTQWVAVFAAVLVVGPILLKMLIGHQFDDFRIEARRERAGALPIQPTQPPAVAAQ